MEQKQVMHNLKDGSLDSQLSLHVYPYSTYFVLCYKTYNDLKTLKKFQSAKSQPRKDNHEHTSFLGILNSNF